MIPKFTHHIPVYNEKVHLTKRQVQQILKDYDEYETWGKINIPGLLSSFYLIPKKRLTFPRFLNLQNQEIDYRELSSVIDYEDRAWFCTEFFYSFDDFNQTCYRGTYKIEISPDNQLILDWIVQNQVIYLMQENIKTDILRIEGNADILNFFTSNKGFFLPLKNVRSLATHPLYQKLINRKR